MYRSRSKRNTIQDLEQRLGPFPCKGSMLATNCVRGFPNFITIEDDDDDEVEIYPPRSSVETSRLFPHMTSWVPVVSEEDLELRLGLKAYDEVSSDPASKINVIDDGVEDNFWRCTKQAKLGEQGSGSNRLVEMKLRCAICMDTMREETSTICGHIFCKPCITSAIRVQKKCPTCREKLSMTSIHRIYLPGPTTS